METVQPSIAPASIDPATMNMEPVPSKLCKKETNSEEDEGQEAGSKGAEKALPPLSSAEFRAFNQMAERMDYFVSKFLVYRELVLCIITGLSDLHALS